MADLKLQAIITARDEASKTIKDTSLSFTKLAGAVAAGQLAYNAFAGVARRAVGVLQDSIRVALEAEDANVKMTQMLKNSGTVTNEQIENLRRYAEAMQYKVGIDDEAIKQGIAMLGSFKLQGSTIERTIPALMDLAAAYRRTTGEAVDLQHWAIMLGKAEALPELATMMRRVGIVFSDAQIAMLKTADEEERVRIITEELSREFGGVAEAMGTTTAGKIAILKLRFEELKESMGSAILVSLMPALDRFSNWFAENQARIEATAASIGNAIVTAIQGIVSAITFLANLWDTWWGKTLILVLGVAVVAITAAFGSIIALIGLIIAAIGGVILWWEMLWQVASMAWEKTRQAVQNFVNAFIGQVNIIRAFGLGMWNGFVAAAQSVWNTIVGIVKGAVDAVVNTISRIKSAISGLGGKVRGMLGFQAGGIVPETGMYLMHRGERVTPEGSFAGGNNITVQAYFYGNINQSSGDLGDIGRQLARSIELSMQGISG